MSMGTLRQGAAAVSCVAVLTLAQVGFGFSFKASALVGLVLIMVTIAWLAFFIWRAVRGRSWRAALTALAVVPLVVVSGVAARSINEHKRLTSLDEADQVIEALSRHRRAHGAYPRSLEELVPAELRAVPRSRMGLIGDIAFVYRGNADSFDLSFALPNWKRCSYSSEERSWAVHD